MPATSSDAVAFLETRWSSINENKTNGILAEVRLNEFLTANNCHVAPGGLLMTPGTNTKAQIPTKEKLCVLPRRHSFSWETGTRQDDLTLAEISAYLHFRQAGIATYFARPTAINERTFERPTPSSDKVKARFPRSYDLELLSLSPESKLVPVRTEEVFKSFSVRQKGGLSCRETDRLNRADVPWNTPDVVSRLFWFEYTRYFFQVQYLVTNNDLDLFLIGPSGTPYPVELKSKQLAEDERMGDWFGIDLGPFAKLSFFTANRFKNDALFVVEEVDGQRQHVEWHAIRFTELVEACSWVGQAGGTGMGGGRSSTIRVPQLAFSRLVDLLPSL